MSTWIESLDNWNPQFLRECRGRLRPRSVLAAVGLSTLFQILLGLFVSQGLEYLEPQEQWLRICKTLTWFIPYGLFVLGSYYLVSDLTQEEKKGTLNFIRLSPRPAHEILLGKLLGVPVLPYLLVASAVPLQVISALMGGISLGFEVSYYVTLLVYAIFIFTVAILVGLTSRSQTFLVGQQAPTSIAFAGLALFFFAPAFMFWNQASTWYSLYGRERLFGDIYTNPLEWLYLPISDNGLVAHGFMLGNLAIAVGLIWQILQRQFRNPMTTLLSKRLSYWVVAYVNILVWGFFQVQDFDFWEQEAGLVTLYCVNYGLFLFLYFGLNPQRQMLLDWQRYRSRSFWLELIWGDKSPAVVAIAINLLIAAGLILPWLLIQFGDNFPRLVLVLAILSIGLSFITYATLVQIIFSTRLRNPYIWGVGVLATIIFVPLIIMAIFGTFSADSMGVMVLWTFLGYPFGVLSEADTLRGMGLGILLQGLLLALLLWRLNLNLRTLKPSRR